MKEIFGEKGKLNYSWDNLKVQCHICGKYFRGLLSSHVPRIHKMSGYDYKKEFGLFNTYGIVGQETKKLYSNKMKSLRLAYPDKFMLSAEGGNLTTEPKRLQYILSCKNSTSVKTRLIKARYGNTKRALLKYEKMKRMVAIGMSPAQIAYVMGYSSGAVASTELWDGKKIEERQNK